MKSTGRRNEKHLHVDNQVVNALMEQGQSMTQIGKYYNVSRHVIQSRMRTIKKHKEKGVWVTDPNTVVPDVAPRRNNTVITKYKPIWELPKQNSEVEVYKMDISEVQKKYGEVGQYKEQVPSHLWNLEVTINAES